jgi:hypothetical protein
MMWLTRCVAPLVLDRRPVCEHSLQPFLLAFLRCRPSCSRPCPPRRRRPHPATRAPSSSTDGVHTTSTRGQHTRQQRRDSPPPTKVHAMQQPLQDKLWQRTPCMWSARFLGCLTARFVLSQLSRSLTQVNQATAGRSSISHFLHHAAVRSTAPAAPPRCSARLTSTSAPASATGRMRIRGARSPPGCAGPRAVLRTAHRKRDESSVSSLSAPCPTQMHQEWRAYPCCSL